jgi:branched-chain amino acid transport system ATP-binding protein
MLEVAGLAVSYGRHRALEGVSLKVAKGEICVILGANGAGKSTLLKAIAGMVKSEAGDVAMNGRPIARLKPHHIVEEGIALVPEGRGIFGELTVAENLQLGAFAARARHSEKATLDSVYTLFPRLAERKRQVARTMSGGEQQMVAIGRALMSRPDILMLDEPSLGLSPLLTQELFKALTEVAKTGVGILLVEQNARQSLKIAERGYLIENGHVAGENSAKALMNDPAVVAAYLGGASRAAAPAMRRPQPAVSIPGGFRLPGSVEGIGQFVSSLAGRAGAISQAFVRSARRETTLPSAFVGRFDPKAGPDPWAEVAAQPAPPPHQVARAEPTPEARQAAGRAALLAVRATERLAAHVASNRMSRPVPSGFTRQFPPPADDAPRQKLNGSHGLIGHNSAGLDLDGEQVAPSQPAPIVVHPAPAPGPTIAELAARAAAIQAAHIADSRKRLTAFTVPVAAPAAESGAPVETLFESKPAKKRKKKHRKEK